MSTIPSAHVTTSLSRTPAWMTSLPLTTFCPVSTAAHTTVVDGPVRLGRNFSFVTRPRVGSNIRANSAAVILAPCEYSMRVSV